MVIVVVVVIIRVSIAWITRAGVIIIVMVVRGTVVRVGQGCVRGRRRMRILTRMQVEALGIFGG